MPSPSLRIPWTRRRCSPPPSHPRCMARARRPFPAAVVARITLAALRATRSCRVAPSRQAHRSQPWRHRRSLSPATRSRSPGPPVHHGPVVQCPQSWSTSGPWTHLSHAATGPVSQPPPRRSWLFCRKVPTFFKNKPTVPSSSKVIRFKP